MALLTTGLPATDEVKRSLVPQTLNNLIDETLKQQEIDKSGIKVNEDEVRQQIETIAQRQKISTDELYKKLSDANIPPQTLEKQIRTEIGWANFVRQRLKPKVDVSFNEVQKEIKKIKNNAGKKEVRLAEIFIEIKTAQDEPKAEQTIRQLEKQLRSNAPFPLLAQQFSASPSAAKNGEIGWIIPDEIEEETLRTAIKKLNKKELSPIIRGKDGFYLFFNIDERQAKGFEEHQLRLHLKRIASQSLDSLQNNVAQIKGCVSMDHSYPNFPHKKTGDINAIPLDTLSDPLQKIIKPLDIAELSSIAKEGDTYTRYMVCRKTFPSRTDSYSQEEVANRIGAEQLDLLQRHHLRQLKASSFIDIRL